RSLGESLLLLCSDVSQEVQQTESQSIVTLKNQLVGIELLLVEDNIINQELAVELLRQAGARVTVAHHGQEALDKLAQQSFDCVLMDGQMPIMDGYEATRRIRSQSQCADLPIIAMTANAMPRDVTRALAAGMNAQISKPFQVKELYSTIVKHLDVQRPRLAVTPAPTGNAPHNVEVVLPRIQGLNIDTGMALCNHNADLYRHLLELFVLTGANLLKQQQNEFLEGNISALQLSFHTLKSVAGNIGAVGISETVSLLEVSLAEIRAARDANQGNSLHTDVTVNTPCPALDALTEDISRLHADLQRLLTSLALWQADNQPDEALQQITNDELMALLTQLRQSFKEYNTDALTLVEQLSQLTVLQPQRQLIQALKQATGQFDFSLGLERLIELEEWAEQHLRKER
ncbi:MAG: response regulator, partial [Shewanella sp.]